MVVIVEWQWNKYNLKYEYLKAPYERIMNKEVHFAWNGVTGAPPWSQAWGWGLQAAPVGLAFAHGTQSGAARMSNVGPPSSRLTIHRRVHKGLMLRNLDGGRRPRCPNSRTVTLAMGTWNVTSLEGKEPELVQEVERYRLEIVGLTSTYNLGSGT